MSDMANTAKATMQDLDAELASLQGREMDSTRIKQAQKLADLQVKMAEATARGNTEEMAYYERALSLQRQINAETDRQASTKAAEQAIIDFGQAPTTTNLNAKDVVNSWNARLEQAKQEAKQELMQEMIDASKRQVY